MDVEDAGAVAKALAQIEIECRAEDGKVEYYVDGRKPGEAIRTPAISMNSSKVATVKEVRDKVTALLRGMTALGDLVVEGRDITTAVFPESPARFYLTASADARARRRQKQDEASGIATRSEEAVKASLLARDERDSTRKFAPLKKADGAMEIDSSDMTLEEVVETVISALPEEWRRAKDA